VNEGVLSEAPAVIAGASNTDVGTIAVGSSPLVVAANPATRQIYIANTVSNTVSVFEDATGTVIATIPIGSGLVQIRCR